jgi:hypothetical protein
MAKRAFTILAFLAALIGAIVYFLSRQPADHFDAEN